MPHTHSHHHSVPVLRPGPAIRPSLLLMSAGGRAALAVLPVLLLWLGVAWALA